MGAVRKIELPSFSVTRSLEYARDVLSRPPKWPHVVRGEPVGELVTRFVLPLELCPTSNVRMQSGFASQRWRLAQLKRATFSMMFAQLGHTRREPLPGRPMVRCIRFSSTETDRTSDWSKNPVDRLCCGKNGLRLLRDDKPSCADVRTWCEYAPPRFGFVMVDVWSGEEGPA